MLADIQNNGVVYKVIEVSLEPMESSSEDDAATVHVIKVGEQSEHQEAILEMAMREIPGPVQIG